MPAAPDTTRARILAAARDEFAAVGFAGARVDAIARAAGCNKQLLYHYFTDKHGLWEAVMLDVLSCRPPLVAVARADFAEHAVRELGAMAGMRTWFRILGWESLSHGEADAPLAAEEVRRSHAAQAADAVAAAQANGAIDPAFPPRFLLLALMGAAAIPFVLPQVARILTGLDPRDPAFREQYAAVLGRIVARLGPDTTPPTGPDGTS